MAAFAGSFAKTNSPRKMKRTKSLPRSAEQTTRSKVKRTKSGLRRAVSFAPRFAFLTAHSSLFSSRGSFHGGGAGERGRWRRAEPLGRGVQR